MHFQKAVGRCETAVYRSPSLALERLTERLLPIRKDGSSPLQEVGIVCAEREGS